ncbi:hypothetical protein [Jiangella endophytica]|uniref:hypothetical protein n=1 Tax=Jiangella endophytica TaxID=1623398 RepID=UPI000E349D5E|nr:hypothetical protein [Jiangella endophytica]
MTGRFDRPGLLATVTSAAVLDGTPQVIRNVVTHATARRTAVPAAQPAREEPAREEPAGRRLVAVRSGAG